MGTQDDMVCLDGTYYNLVSIQLMSPASGNKINCGDYQVWEHKGFHSINVPSEWEPLQLKPEIYRADVSIQLMSPASGNNLNGLLTLLYNFVSIQLMSPASGNMTAIQRQIAKYTFPFN